jgi:hypothetical protein
MENLAVDGDSFIGAAQPKELVGLTIASLG